MNCDEAAERLHACLYGELHPSDDADLSAHLAGCRSCRERVESLYALQDKIRGSLRSSVELRDVADSVMSMLPRRERRRLSLGWAWAAAACAAVLALVVMLPRQDSRDSRGAPNPRASVRGPGTTSATKPQAVMDSHQPPSETVRREAVTAQAPGRVPRSRRRCRVRTAQVHGDSTSIPPCTRQAVSDRSATIVVRTEHDPMSDGRERRNRTSVSISTGRLRIRHTTEYIMRPIERIPPVEPIDRPPLSAAVEGDAAVRRSDGT